MTVKEHKVLKSLKTQNLRDHMGEAELIFTALAELSTRQIAESEQAEGFNENKKPARKGVITGENFLKPKDEQNKIDESTCARHW